MGRFCQDSRIMYTTGYLERAPKETTRYVPQNRKAEQFRVAVFSGGPIACVPSPANVGSLRSAAVKKKRLMALLHCRCQRRQIFAVGSNRRISNQWRGNHSNRRAAAGRGGRQERQPVNPRRFEKENAQSG